ncbi:hypothetical protein PENTCL1PPCAC_12719, partial [Pristionchus entomophagus]
RRCLDPKRAFVCKSGANDCMQRGTILSCRKCRFDRFKKIFDNACASEKTGEYDFYSDPEQSPETSYDPSAVVEKPSPTFIDHNHYFDCSSSSDTTILGRMKQAYSALCTVRKAREIS